MQWFCTADKPMLVQHTMVGMCVSYHWCPKFGKYLKPMVLVLDQDQSAPGSEPMVVQHTMVGVPIISFTTGNPAYVTDYLSKLSSLGLKYTVHLSVTKTLMNRKSKERISAWINFSITFPPRQRQRLSTGKGRLRHPGWKLD